MYHTKENIIDHLWNKLDDKSLAKENFKKE